MLWDWNTGDLAAGLACYRTGEFFAAHEHWENVWRQCRGEEKIFLQALIQLAGALHHHRRNNPRGTLALLRASLTRLEPYPEHFGGLSVMPLRQELTCWIANLQSGEPFTPQPYPGICVDHGAPQPGTDVPGCPNHTNRKI